MEVEDAIFTADGFSPEVENEQPSKKKSRLNDVSSCHEDRPEEGRYNGVNIEDLVVLEICAGSARLTKAARAKGFKGIAVDHSSERSCGVDNL